MNRKYLLVYALLSLALGGAAQKLMDPILLWSSAAPAASGISDEDKPAIIPFIPAKTISMGAAVLVIPGGGFTIKEVDHEGVLVAQWLKSKGITAFLLRYRLMPLYERKDWLLEGQRAIQYIRSQAKEYGEFLRKINLNPSIENQREYRKQRPGDKKEYTVEIKNNQDL